MDSFQPFLEARYNENSSAKLEVLNDVVKIESSNADFNPSIEDINQASVYSPMSKGILKQSSGNTEGLLQSGDRRKKISKWYSCDCIGQLVVQFDDGIFVGSGFIYHIDKDHKKAVVMTCAHNFYREVKKISKEVVKKKHITANFYLKRTANSFGTQHKVTKVLIHPQYYKDTSADGGYDFALAIIESDDIKCGKYGTFAADTFHGVGNRVSVRGYPGEKEGDAYFMQGHIIAKWDHLLCYDLDTTPGNSGSPLIMLYNVDKDEEVLKVIGKKEIDFEDGRMPHVIGIHIAYSVADRCNFATRYTMELHSWVQEMALKYLGEPRKELDNSYFQLKKPQN